ASSPIRSYFGNWKLFQFIDDLVCWDDPIHPTRPRMQRKNRLKVAAPHLSHRVNGFSLRLIISAGKYLSYQPQAKNLDANHNKQDSRKQQRRVLQHNTAAKKQLLEGQQATDECA